MKRVFALILALCLLCPLLPALAAPAQETALAVQSGNSQVDTAVLRDGKDTTGLKFKKGKSVSLNLETQGLGFTSLYVRMKQIPAVAELRQKQGQRFVPVATLKSPGPEFVLSVREELTGKFILALTFDSAEAAEILELRAYGTGSLPDSLPSRKNAGLADILLIAATPVDVDVSAVRSWLQAGRSVAVTVLTQPGDAPLTLSDSLWKAGLKTAPQYLNQKTPSNLSDSKAVASAWSVNTVLPLLVSAMRKAQPGLTVLAGRGAGLDWLRSAARQAADSAADPLYEIADAEVNGLWLHDRILTAGDSGISALLADWPERSTDALRARLGEPYADAVHSDPAGIPYPVDRGADGYMPAGREFVHEDEEAGLWAYLSDTLQVEIVKYEQPSFPRVWFVTDVKFDPKKEKFAQVLYPGAHFEGQLTYPETLAQSARLVLGINGDYYPYRVNHKANVGNIIRNYEVLYTYNEKKMTGYPVLDTAALRDDGSITVYAAGSITAAQLKSQGNVHDALSFGPYLAKNGKIRLWTGKSWDANEPRCAIGMVEPGHFKILTVEGRFNKGVGPAGINLNQLACMMYSLGVTEAQNLDGGNTAVLIFMGKKLNRTASKSGKGITQPRNMHELFGIGTSEQVHTDLMNGRK